MRAPPLVEIMMTGSSFSVPLSIRRVSFSPTTEPIEPPRKLKSITPSATRCSPILPMPVTTASFRPVAFWCSLSLALYDATPLNPKTSTLPRLSSISWKVQVSTNECMRSRERIGKWCWQLRQTFRFSSNSLSKTIVLHLGHFVHNPSGMSRFRDLAASLGFLTNEVFPVAGGGVTPGSTTSVPRFFLEKFAGAGTAGFSAALSAIGRGSDLPGAGLRRRTGAGGVVDPGGMTGRKLAGNAGCGPAPAGFRDSFISKLGAHYSNWPGQCPDTNLAGPSRQKHPCQLPCRRARGHHIVHQQHFFAPQLAVFRHFEGPANVR